MNKSNALETLVKVGRLVDTMPGSEFYKQNIDLLIAQLEAIIMTTWDRPIDIIDQFKMLCATLISLVYSSKAIEGDQFIVDKVEEKLSAIILSIENNI